MRHQFFSLLRAVVPAAPPFQSPVRSVSGSLGAYELAPNSPGIPGRPAASSSNGYSGGLDIVPRVLLRCTDAEFITPAAYADGGGAPGELKLALCPPCDDPYEVGPPGSRNGSA